MVVLNEKPLSNVVFVIEGSANLSSYFEQIKLTYICPTLEYFFGGSINDSEIGYERNLNSALFAVVDFNTYDAEPSQSTNSRGPTALPSKLLQWIDEISFPGGVSPFSNIGEGLANALQCFDDLDAIRENSNQNPKNVKKHCVLVCNSSAFPLPTSESVSYNGLLTDQLISLFTERNINLSIFSPRKIPFLFKLFEKANGDMKAAFTKNYAKDARHLILLKEFQLQEHPQQIQKQNVPPVNNSTTAPASNQSNGQLTGGTANSTSIDIKPSVGPQKRPLSPASASTGGPPTTIQALQNPGQASNQPIRPNQPFNNLVNKQPPNSSDINVMKINNIRGASPRPNWNSPVGQQTNNVASPVNAGMGNAPTPPQSINSVASPSPVQSNQPQQMSALSKQLSTTPMRQMPQMNQQPLQPQMMNQQQQQSIQQQQIPQQQQMQPQQLQQQQLQQQPMQQQPIQQQPIQQQATGNVVGQQQNMVAKNVVANGQMGGGNIRPQMMNRQPLNNQPQQQQQQPFNNSGQPINNQPYLNNQPNQMAQPPNQLNAQQNQINQPNQIVYTPNRASPHPQIVNQQQQQMNIRPPINQVAMNQGMNQSMGPNMNAGMNQGPMMQQQQQQQQQAPMGQQQVLKRNPLWEGILEFKFMQPMASQQPQQQTMNLSCKIYSHPPNQPTTQDLRPETWPNKILLQFVSRNLVAKQLPSLKTQSTTVSLLFDKTKEEYNKLVSHAQSPTAFGIITFGNMGSRVRVMMIVYQEKMQAFLGLIPNDQEAFIKSLNEEKMKIQQQQQNKMQQQQQQQQQLNQSNMNQQQPNMVMAQQIQPGQQQMNPNQMNQAPQQQTFYQPQGIQQVQVNQQVNQPLIRTVTVQQMGAQPNQQQPGAGPNPMQNQLNPQGQAILLHNALNNKAHVAKEEPGRGNQFSMAPATHMVRQQLQNHIINSNNNMNNNNANLRNLLQGAPGQQVRFITQPQQIPANQQMGNPQQMNQQPQQQWQ